MRVRQSTPVVYIEPLPGWGAELSYDAAGQPGKQAFDVVVLAVRPAAALQMLPPDLPASKLYASYFTGESVRHGSTSRQWAVGRQNECGRAPWSRGSHWLTPHAKSSSPSREPPPSPQASTPSCAPSSTSSSSSHWTQALLNRCVGSAAAVGVGLTQVSAAARGLPDPLFCCLCWQMYLAACATLHAQGTAGGELLADDGAAPFAVNLEPYEWDQQVNGTARTAL